jgi:hypothetical protein
LFNILPVIIFLPSKLLLTFISDNIHYSVTVCLQNVRGRVCTQQNKASLSEALEIYGSSEGNEEINKKTRIIQPIKTFAVRFEGK